jgi:hypothetical protein
LTIPNETKAASRADKSKAFRISDLLPLQYFLDDLEIVLRASVLRIDREHAFEGVRGGLLALHLDVHQPEAGERADMPGLELQGAVDVGERLLVIAHQVVERRPLVPALGEVRLLRDDRIELLQRRSVPRRAHRLGAFGHQLVDRRIMGLEPDGPDLRLDLQRRHRIGRRLQGVEQGRQPRILLVGRGKSRACAKKPEGGHAANKGFPRERSHSPASIALAASIFSA